MKREEQNPSVVEQPAAEQEKKTPFWKNKKFRMGSTATVLTAVFVAVVVLINVLVGALHDRYPLNIDLTSEKLYTLSKESETLASKVDKEVQIVVFGAESSYKDAANTIYRQVYEFSKQYETLSGGKVTLSFVDATTQPAEFAKYSDYNVESGDILFLGEKGQSAVTAETDLYEYDETSYYYYGQYVLTSSMVEKVIANNIQTVCRESTVSVTLFTGHVESEDTLSAVQSMLRQNGYGSIEMVDITTVQEVKSESQIAFICAPAEDYTDLELNRLGDWLSNGGKRNRDLIVIADNEATCPRLYEYLENEHGIKVHDELVADTNYSNLFSMSSGYATYATVSDSEMMNNMSEDARIKVPNTRWLSSAWATDSSTESSYATQLAAFESETAIKVPIKQDNSAKEEKYEALDQKNAAVLMTTQLYFDSSDGAAHETNVTVFGSELFFNYDGNNEKLFVNLFNKLNETENTVSIDSVSLEAETLDIDAGTAMVLGVVFALVLPVLVLAAGLIVFLRRRHL